MERQRTTLTKIFIKLELKQIDNSIKTKVQGLGRHKMAFSLIFLVERCGFLGLFLFICFCSRLEMDRHLQSLFYQAIVSLRFLKFLTEMKTFDLSANNEKNTNV